MKRSKLMIEILTYLHYHRREKVVQKNLVRYAYSIATTDLLNGTVRADVSRTIKQLLEEGYIKRSDKYKYELSKGIDVLIKKPKKWIIHTFRNRGTKKYQEV